MARMTDAAFETAREALGVGGKDLEAFVAEARRARASEAVLMEAVREIQLTLRALDVNLPQWDREGLTARGDRLRAFLVRHGFAILT